MFLGTSFDIWAVVLMPAQPEGTGGQERRQETAGYADDIEN